MILVIVFWIIPLALRLYLEYYILVRDKKNFINILSFAIISIGSIYYTVFPFIIEYDIRESSSEILVFFLILVLDGVFSVFQTVRVFVVKFGVQIRLFRCASMMMLVLVCIAGLGAVLFE